MATINNRSVNYGETYVARNVYEASAVSIADVIETVVVPAGVRVKGITVTHDALGASSTLAIGDNASSTTYAAAEATSSAGNVVAAFTADTAGNQYTAAQATAGENIILLTVGGGAVTGTIVTEVELYRDYN